MLIAAAALLIAAAPAAAATLRGFTPEQAAQVDAVVQTTMAEQNVPGVNVAVYGPGGAAYENSYGVSDTATNAPMDPADTIRIASISKTFTAVEVLRLIDRGKLRLKDKLSDYVKHVPNGKRITIKQLLGMTGGIYDFTRDDEFNAAFSANPLFPGWEPTDVLGILALHPPDFEPGAMVSYSDSNYILLGLIIEQITDKRVDKVIDRLSAKAGLSRTSFPTNAKLSPPAAHGYYGGDDGTEPLQDYTRVNPDVAWTAGAMLSTVADLKRWAKLLCTGKLISDRLFKRQIAFRPIPNPGPSIGYGLGMFQLADWIGHNGAIYGFNTAMFYLPSNGARIVISANKSTNFSSETIDMFFQIAGELFPGTTDAA